MEVIEKTRWEGDKTVGVEIVRTRMKRGMDEMKRVLKINKFGKTRKDTRWKRGEFVVVERENGMRVMEEEGKEMREITKFCEVGKHTRRKNC